MGLPPFSRLKKRKKMRECRFFLAVFLSVSLSPSLLPGQTTFLGNPRNGTPQWGFPGHGVLVGDFNGDGYEDLVALNYDIISGALKRRELVGTDSSFWNRLLLNQGNGTFVESPGSLPRDNDIEDAGGAVGDIDGDGDLDFLTADVNWIYVYLNDGKGRFKRIQSGRGLLLKGADPIWEVFLKDLDGDGDLDIYVATASRFLNTGQDHFFQNDGKGWFKDVTATHLPRMLDYPMTTVFGDFDGDGDLDIVKTNKVSVSIGSNKETIYWENKGRGFFKDASWKVAGLHTFWKLMVGFNRKAADMDGDGDLDLLLVPLDCGRPMYIALNDGKGNFSDNSLLLVPPKKGWPQTVMQGNNRARDTLIMDVNADGKPDIIGGSAKDPVLADMYPNQGGRPRLWLNMGKGVMKEVTDTHFKGVTLTGMVYYYEGDFDKDGDPDFAYSGIPVKVFLNDGKGHFRDATFLDVPSDASSPMVWGKHIKSGDIDGDGDPDLVVGTAGLGPTPTSGIPLILLDNDGEGRLRDVTATRLPKFNFRVSTSTLYVDLHDLDGDGDLDILFNWGTSYVLYNNGKGVFPKYDFSPVPSSSLWVWLDMDGDGDEDAVNSPDGGCYENLGKGKYRHRVLPKPPGYHGFSSLSIPSDVDRDGKKDLVCVDYHNSWRDGIWVFHWEGKWKFSLWDHVRTGLMGLDYIRVKDLDGDGYPDVIGRAGWALKNDRTGHFSVIPNTGIFRRHGVTTGGTPLDQFEVEDLDGDGLPEVITVGGGDWDENSGIPGWFGLVNVWKNLGDFHFTIDSHRWVELRGIGILPSWGQVMELVDIDRDGDLDLLQQPFPGTLNIRYNLFQQCALSGVLGLGKKALVKVFGIPGDQVALFGGVPGKPVLFPGIGVLRLGNPNFFLKAGLLKAEKERFNAVMKWEARVPKAPALLGAAIRFQAFIQRPGRGVFLTGSDTGKVGPY